MDTRVDVDELRRLIELDEVRRRLDAGQTPGDIGRALGRTTSAVHKAAKRLGYR